MEACFLGKGSPGTTLPEMHPEGSGSYRSEEATKLIPGHFFSCGSLPFVEESTKSAPHAPALAQRLKRFEQALVDVVKTAVGKDRY
jgi:hypothetical protein